MDTELNIEVWRDILKIKHILGKSCIDVQTLIEQNFEGYFGYLISYDDRTLYFSGFCFPTMAEASKSLQDYIEFLCERFKRTSRHVEYIQ